MRDTVQSKTIFFCHNFQNVLSFHDQWQEWKAGRGEGFTEKEEEEGEEEEEKKNIGNTTMRE